MVEAIPMASLSWKFSKEEKNLQLVVSAII